MPTDRVRWNEKYSSKTPPKTSKANPRLVELLSSLPAGLACDVAMGVGHNMSYLCSAGWKVVGIEISDVALMQAQRYLDGQEGAMLLQSDVAHLGLKSGSFDLVVCTYFLDRSIFPWFRSLLKKGGKLFFETYDAKHLKYMPDFPEEFCLRDGELKRLLSGFHFQQKHIDSGTASVQSVIATLA